MHSRRNVRDDTFLPHDEMTPMSKPKRFLLDRSPLSLAFLHVTSALAAARYMRESQMRIMSNAATHPRGLLSRAVARLIDELHHTAPVLPLAMQKLAKKSGVSRFSSK